MLGDSTFDPAEVKFRPGLDLATKSLSYKTSMDRENLGNT